MQRTITIAGARCTCRTCRERSLDKQRWGVFVVRTSFLVYHAGETSPSGIPSRQDRADTQRRAVDLQTSAASAEARARNARAEADIERHFSCLAVGSNPIPKELSRTTAQQPSFFAGPGLGFNPIPTVLSRTAPQEPSQLQLPTNHVVPSPPVGRLSCIMHLSNNSTKQRLL